MDSVSLSPFPDAANVAFCPRGVHQDDVRGVASPAVEESEEAVVDEFDGCECGTVRVKNPKK